tara:strand:+ start:232 stop:522 length:291 start_codon:yes stop_codon:yes gene_type:complete
MNITIKTKNNKYTVNEYGSILKVKEEAAKRMSTFDKSISYKEMISETRVIKSVVNNMLSERKFYNDNDIENKIYSCLKSISIIKNRGLSKRYKILK